MPLKLIYTSAPRLLQAGRSGFGTVAMSRDIPFQAVKLAEECSKFSRQSGLSAERVVYSYRTVRCSDGFWHILSCLRDAGTDYSGRTNHLAQHLMFDSREASACAWEGKTPAGVILGTAWPDHDGFCGWIEDGVYWDALEPEPTWQWWGHYAGSGDCRRNLSSEAALRGAVLIYGRGLESQTAEDAKKVLCLYAESHADCPEHGWGVTFTTGLEPNDELSEFRWIGVAENSPMLPKVEAAGGRVRVTFDTPPPLSRQSGSKRPPSEVRAPDASGAAALQQQNYGIVGEGAASNVHDSGAKPPPLGPRTPPRPVPWVPERGVLGRLTDYWKPLAFAAGLLLAASAAYILLFPPPPQIEFIKTTLPAYTGEPVQLQIRTIPPGREHEVTIEPQNIAKAGKTKVTASIEGKWLGAGTNVTGYIIIPPKPAKIVFVSQSLKQVWPDDANKNVSVFVEPETDEGNKEPLTNKVEFLYKSESQDESAWTTEKPRPVGNQTNFDVMARISADANYTAEARTNMVVTVTNQLSRTESSSATTSTNTPAAANPSAESQKTSAPLQASAIRFLLAEKSQMLRLLPDLMPTNGVLNVERCDDSGQSAEIDRGSGNWLKGEEKGGFNDQLFDMTDRVPVKRTPKSGAPVDVDGPLVYIVAEREIPSFVAVELVPGDNSGVMQRFFQRVHLEKKQDKPRIQFSLKDEGGRVGLDQFMTDIGGRFVLEITEHPYDETTPLQLFFSPNGELESAVEQEHDKLTGELAKAAADKAAQTTAKTPWDQAKSELLKPLKETLSQKPPDPRAETLVKAIEGIAQPPAGTSHTNSVILVGTLIAETFRVLETDPLTSSLVKLSRDRADEKEDRKKPGSGSQSLSSIMDVSLLTPQEWIERLQTDKSSAANWKTKAIEWIRGREEDVKANKGDEKDQKTVTAILGGLSQGIQNVKVPTVNERNNAQTVQKDNIDPEVRIQEKRDFLESLGSPPSSDSRPKKGRLLLVPDKAQGSVASTNILWPNVLLFSGPVQEAIK
jgi:hypothetical protein